MPAALRPRTDVLIEAGARGAGYLGAVQYRELRPHARLAAVIQSYWTLRGVGPPGGVERVVPDGSTELVLHFGESFHRIDGARGRERQSRALFVGQMTEHVLLEPGLAVDVIGVRFQPGGAGAFVRTPMPELADEIQDLSDVQSTRDSCLLDRVGELDDTDDRLAVLERELLDRIDPSAGVDPVVAHVAGRLNESGGNCSLDALAAECGLGARQLQRRFRAGVGIGPKLFARITRFQRALSMLDGRVHGRLAELAASCGYFDQAHLIRDFRQLAGITPGRFLTESHELSDHLTGIEP